MNLNEQIDLFEITVESALPSHFDTSCELSEHLSESIFLLSVGSNDYINNYLDDTYDTIKRYTPKRFAKLLIDALSHRFKVIFLSLPLFLPPKSMRVLYHLLNIQILLIRLLCN